jgi:hypothetical protein
MRKMMKLKFCYLDGGFRSDGSQVLHSVGIVSDTPEQERYQLYLGSAVGNVGRRTENCDHALSLIDAAQRGEAGPFEYNVDDVQINVASNKIQVDINVNDDWVGKPEGLIDTDVWKQALEGKKRFLALPVALKSVVELDFPSL